MGGVSSGCLPDPVLFLPNSGLLKGGESLGPPAEAHPQDTIRPMTDNEFSVGLDWPLELTRDPAVRRNGGLNAHRGSLKGCELNRAGPDRARRGLVETVCLPSLLVFWPTLRLWFMGEQASLAFQIQSCLQVSVVPMVNGLGQTWNL